MKLAPPRSRGPNTTKRAPSASATRTPDARVATGPGPQRFEGAPLVGGGKRRRPGALERARQRLLDGGADPAGCGPGRPRRREDHGPPRRGERRGEQEREGAHAWSSIPAGGRAQACAAKARWTVKPSRS